MALLAAATVACSSVLNKFLTRRMSVVSLNATRTTGAATFLSSYSSPPEPLPAYPPSTTEDWVS